MLLEAVKKALELAEKYKSSDPYVLICNPAVSLYIQQNGYLQENIELKEIPNFPMDSSILMKKDDYEKIMQPWKWSI